MDDRHARYAALESAKESDTMGMELEERGVGATLRLWNDLDLKLLSDVRAQDAVRTAVAMEFANKSSGDDVTLSNMRSDERDDNGRRCYTNRMNTVDSWHYKTRGILRNTKGTSLGRLATCNKSD